MKTNTNRLGEFENLDSFIEWISKNYGTNIGEFCKRKFDETEMTVDEIYNLMWSSRRKQMVSPARFKA